MLGNIARMELQIGDRVGVHSAHGHDQGMYEVTTVNKVKIIIRRLTDNYERVFSMKHDYEMSSAKSHWTSAYLVSPSEYDAARFVENKRRNIAANWKELEEAVAQRNISLAQHLLDFIKNLEE